ncbi:Peptidase S9 prolyl oligopeptidase catalytic domain [Trinorchestia longiramus]|nr:Peptidase S9 prolyl oligopeptidase catalytic domain [Trinorchestia longiramus]
MENKWQVAPDTTVQVVEPPGAKEENQAPEPRNWASIIISLSIIFSVLLLVLMATLLMGPQEPPFLGRRMVMDDLFDPKLKPLPMAYQWLGEDKLAYLSEGAGVRLLDLSIGSNSTLVTDLAMRQTSADSFSVSPDLRYVLLRHDVQRRGRNSVSALYSIYDIFTNHYYPLTISGGDTAAPAVPVRLQYAQWAAQSLSKTTHNNATEDTGWALVVVRNGSVLYLTNPSAAPINLTPDADPDLLTYGQPDLLYEDILEEETAVWPSPEGRSLLVGAFNDSGVRVMPVLRYKGGFPHLHSLRYPTVGTPLPEVSLWLYDLTGPHFPPTRYKLLPPPALRNSGHYLVGSGWVKEDRVWVSWVAGDLSSSALTLCNAPFWFCSTVLHHQQVGGVSPVVRGVRWAGKWVAFPWGDTDSEGTWHDHVALIGEAGGRRAPLTSSRYHVREVLSASLSSRLVYFSGRELSTMKEGEPGQHVYRTYAGSHGEVYCVTCDIKNKNVKFVSSIAKKEIEDTPEDLIFETQWDEWKGVLRDVYDWLHQDARQSLDFTETPSGSYSGSSVSGKSGEAGNNIKSFTEEEEEDESTSRTSGEYRPCTSVTGTMSPSTKYLAAVCEDVNGVPPSLWLLDLSMYSPTDLSDGNQVDESNEISGVMSVEEEERQSQNFGNQDTEEERRTSQKMISKLHPPLLLHSQTAPRLAMGVMGMPATLNVGIRVGMTEAGGVGTSHRGAKLYLPAQITLTLPPGWSREDDSLLYPLAVQIVGSHESLHAPENTGPSWADYLASGHQVAHARVQLWGSDPSGYRSTHQLAEAHLEAVRQLLSRYDFLDATNVAVYGMGGEAASVALEAAALTPPFFQCVAAVNPIIDWQMSSVYHSERLLGSLTQEGAEQRYVESDGTRLPAELRNNTPILLVHGTSDQFSHHGFNLARALNEFGSHFSHVVYPDSSPSTQRSERHLLAELEYFIFTWIHDPLIYEDLEGKMLEDDIEENVPTYETRFDIRRSYLKLRALNGV